jgi:glycosyltransferase involved in cell wall biosynthesis
MSVDRPPPTISVLIPVYNGGEFLARALQSVLGQTFADFECLVLDDGSTDGSGEVAESIARADPRMRVIRRENRGLVATLNELIQLARGELVARMDADDIALPERFGQQAAFLAAHPEVVCVGGGHWIIDEADRTIAAVRQPTDDAKIQALALRGHTTICHPAAMIRTRALRAVGGYRPEFYPTEDLDLWLRLGEVGRLANLDNPVIRYRFHSGSISGQAAQGKQRQAAARTCEAAWARRGLTGVTFDATDAWRPSDDRASRLKFALRYGWMAYNSGFSTTALAYGIKALKIQVTSVESWRLVWVALVRRHGPVAT